MGETAFTPSSLNPTGQAEWSSSSGRDGTTRVREVGPHLEMDSVCVSIAIFQVLCLPPWGTHDLHGCSFTPQPPLHLLLQHCQWPVVWSGRCLFFEWCCYHHRNSGFQSCALPGTAPGSPPGSAPWTSTPLSWVRTSGWTWTPPVTGRGRVGVVLGPLS